MHILSITKLKVNTSVLCSQAMYKLRDNIRSFHVYWNFLQASSYLGCAKLKVKLALTERFIGVFVCPNNQQLNILAKQILQNILMA